MYEPFETGDTPGMGGKYFQIKFLNENAPETYQEMIYRVQKEKNRTIHLNFNYMVQENVDKNLFSEALSKILAIAPQSQIHDSRKILAPEWQDYAQTIVNLPKYGLSMTPAGIVSYEEMTSEEGQKTLDYIKKICKKLNMFPFRNESQIDVVLSKECLTVIFKEGPQTNLLSELQSILDIQKVDYSSAKTQILFDLSQLPEAACKNTAELIQPIADGYNSYYETICAIKEPQKVG